MSDFRFNPYRREYGVLIPPILSEYHMHEVYQPPYHTMGEMITDYSQIMQIPKEWYKYFMDEREFIFNIKGIKLYDTPRQAMTAALRDKLVKSGAVRCTITEDRDGAMLSGYMMNTKFNPRHHPDYCRVIVLVDDLPPEFLKRLDTYPDGYTTKDMCYVELYAHKDEILVAEVEQV